jgi:hypothetical protein
LGILLAICYQKGLHLVGEELASRRCRCCWCPCILYVGKGLQHYVKRFLNYLKQPVTDP